jgi:hypothetical protein
MNNVTQLECRASSSRSKHEGEPSLGLCDRLDRTRDNSQRQLPTDHDYAVPTREYQTDQSSLKPAQAAARSVLGKKQKQRQLQKQPHRPSGVDTVTPYQTNALIVPFNSISVLGSGRKNRVLGELFSDNATWLPCVRFADFSDKCRQAGSPIMVQITMSCCIWRAGARCWGG